MSVPSRRWQNTKSPQTNTNYSLQPHHQFTANVKNYLGLQALSCSLDTCPEGEPVSFSTSSKSISPSSARCTPYSSSLEDTSKSKQSKTNTANTTKERHTNQSNSIVGNTCSDFTRKLIETAFKPKILLEDMPHEAPQITLQPQQLQTSKHSITGTSASPQRTRNHRPISSAAKFRQEAFDGDFNNDIEIDADLDDIDSYMMSVYMAEDSSVYTKGTASTVSTSSSSLTTNRSRHRGASHKRRAHMKQAESGQTLKESGFIRSMQQSSSSFFVEGNWSEKYGWYISKKWDATPGESWDQPNPIFDKEEKLVDI